MLWKEAKSSASDKFEARFSLPDKPPECHLFPEASALPKRFGALSKAAILA
jgi:hypothetical protein